MITLTMENSESMNDDSGIDDRKKIDDFVASLLADTPYEEPKKMEPSKVPVAQKADHSSASPTNQSILVPQIPVPVVKVQPQPQTASSNSSNSGLPLYGPNLPQQSAIPMQVVAAVAQTHKRKHQELEKPQGQSSKSSSSNQQADAQQIIIRLTKSGEAAQSLFEKNSDDESEEVEKPVQKRQKIDSDKPQNKPVVHLCSAPKCFLKFRSEISLNSHYQFHIKLREKLNYEQVQKLDASLAIDASKSTDPDDYTFLGKGRTQCPVPSCQKDLGCKNVQGHLCRFHLKQFFGLPHKCAHCPMTFFAKYERNRHQQYHAEG